jgi:Thioesterase-like superfamily
VHTVFYEPAGPGRFMATSATAGPWSPLSQHGGPPSALAARALEQHEQDGNKRLARVAIDILRPVPVDAVVIRTRTVRPGKRVELVEAVLESKGQEVLHARAWRIATSAAVPAVADGGAPPPVPEQQREVTFPGGHSAGYLAAIDWRFVKGGFNQFEPSAAWGRPTIPLIGGEAISPMCRTLLLADSGSGVGTALDPRQFQYINVDMTVVLQRDPVGEWLLLDAATTMGGNGSGLTETRLSDLVGEVGTGLQTLLVAPR